MSTLPTIPPTIQTYLDLITSEHRDKPKFMASVAEVCQPFVDIMATLYSMIGLFTPNAIGDQLDKVAVWAGVSRDLDTPLAGVYFTWGDAGPGWGQGTWLGPDDQQSGLTVLPDDAFQMLVKFAIAENNWDGTVPGAYTIWQNVMGADFGILIQDNQDRTMLIVFIGLIESVVTKALINGGYFNLRPAGVRIIGYGQPSVANTPVFGWGAQNNNVAGWGTGCWVEPLQ
jgi:hypothetical protein